MIPLFVCNIHQDKWGRLHAEGESLIDIDIDIYIYIYIYIY